MAAGWTWRHALALGLWALLVVCACAQAARAAGPGPVAPASADPATAPAPAGGGAGAAASIQPPGDVGGGNGIAAAAPITVTPVLTTTAPVSPGFGVELRGWASGSAPSVPHPTDSTSALFALPPSDPSMRFRTFDNGVSTLNYTVSGGNPLPGARDFTSVPGFGTSTDQFGVRATGYLSITQSGVYRFATASDDGSTFRLGAENALVVNNDFFQGFSVRTGEVDIQTPGLYRYEVLFYQGGGGGGLAVYALAPGQSTDALLGDSSLPIQVYQGLAPPPDPAVTLADAPDPVVAGTTLTYTLAVGNANNVPAGSVAVTTTLPVSATFLSAASLGGPTLNCTTPPVGGTGQVACTAPSLAGGVTATLGVAVRVDPAVAAGSGLTASASVGSATTDDRPLNNTAVATTTVGTSADLRVAAAGSPNPVMAGGTLTYTLTLANDGPSDAQSVSLSDLLPAGTTFLSLTQTGGPALACATPAFGATGTANCTRATLAAGASAAFTLIVRVNPDGSAGTVITNTATAAGATFDPDGNNNSATVTTGGVDRADLALSVAAAPNPVRAGGAVTYTLTVTNTGPADAQSVTVVDALPASTTFLSAAAAGGGCAGPPVGGNGTVTCTLGNLPVGATRPVTIAVAVAGTAGGATITNSASALSATTDPNGLNNAAAADVTVTAPTPTATATATSTAAATPTATPTATPAGTATATRTPSATPTALTAGNLRFVDPVRVLDTRPESAAGYTAAGAPVAPGVIPAGATVRYRVTGQSFGLSPSGARLARAVALPADATGLLVNVTVVQATPSGGFLTVYPGDAATPPNASTVNPSTAVAANFTTVAVPTSGPNAGTLAVTSVGADRHLLLDVVGYYSPSNPAPGTAGAAGPVRFVTPVRVLDTRAGSTAGYAPDGTAILPAPLAPGALNRFGLAGRTFGAAAIPADATGFLAHVTTVQSAPSGGFTTLLPGDWTPAPGRTSPEVSTVNPSTAIAFNGWAAGLPADGTFGLFTPNRGQDVIVDLLAYWAPSNPDTAGALNLVTPVRVLDTRGSAGGPIGFAPAASPIAAGQLASGSTSRYLLAGQTFAGLTLPADVKGALLNVTTVQGAPGGGFVTVYPGDGASPPNASTVNPATAIAASFWATGLPPLGPGTTNGGTVAVTSVGGPRDVVVDLLGYYR